MSAHMFHLCKILAFVWSSNRSVREMMGFFTPASDLFFCRSVADEWQEKLDFRAKAEWEGGKEQA